MIYDFKFHTTDRNFSGIGRVNADNKKQAEKLVRAEIKKNRPDVKVHEVTIEPSII